MPAGRPLTYNPKKHLKKLIEGVQRSCSLTIGAAFAGVPPRTFMDWVKRGEHEWEQGNESELAELSREVKGVRARRFIEILEDGFTKPNPTFNQNMLPKLFKDEFGTDVDLIEELKSYLHVLRQDVENVRNMKFKSNKES